MREFFLSPFFQSPPVQNLCVLASLALIIFTFISTVRNERWERAIARLRKDKTGIASAIVIVLYLLIGALDFVRISTDTTALDWLTSGLKREPGYSAPFATHTLSTLHPELLRSTHPLGTDILGKDVLTQTLKASRTALIIGGLTSLIYIPLGTLLGLAAGYFRRRTDDLITWLYTTVYSIPEIILLVAIMMLFQKSLITMSIALGVTSWVGLCRLIRGETMRQSGRQYVAAARALGQSHWRIITRHLLPNVMHLVLINFVLGFSGIVLSEAILSYLGVGSPVGTASWGTMIDGARSELSRDPTIWWTLTAATSALFILVLALNLLGDALRKAFDPKRG